MGFSCPRYEKYYGDIKSTAKKDRLPLPDCSETEEDTDDEWNYDLE